MKYVFLEEACRTLLLVVSNTQPSAYIPSDLYVIEDNNIDNIIIPESSREIAPYTFETAPDASCIIFPDGISSLIFGMCKNMKKLKMARLPSGLTTIPDECFKGCESLIEVVLPPNLMIVSDEAFRDCKRLELQLPKTIKEIGEHAFSGCKAIDADLTNAEYLGKHCFKNVSGMTVSLPQRHRLAASLL